MITLLLTFFVMLQSMASVQVEKHKFETGQASIQRALTNFGLSGTPNPVRDLNFKYIKPRYAAKEGSDMPENRSVDAQTEMLRRLLLDIETIAKISPSPIAGANRMYLPTDIHFAAGKTELDKEAKSFLTKYSEQLAANMAGQEITIYVLGIAAGETSERRQWILSAQRAQVTAEFIRSLQPADARWSIYSWGAGTGGEWVGTNGLTSSKTEIMIAVLTENKLPG
jgi:outer membrane protein OmpA-like peptidoglycan-associated protein